MQSCTSSSHHQVLRIEAFRHSGIQAFRHSGIQAFRHSGIQAFRHENNSAAVLNRKYHWPLLQEIDRHVY